MEGYSNNTIKLCEYRGGKITNCFVRKRQIQTQTLSTLSSHSKSILWLAEPVNRLLYISRFTPSSFFPPMFFVLQELLVVNELSGVINNFVLSENTSSLPERCLKSIQKKKKKSGQQRKGTTLKHMHSYFDSGHKSLATLALINYSCLNFPAFLWKPRIKENYILAVDCATFSKCY